VAGVARRVPCGRYLCGNLICDRCISVSTLWWVLFSEYLVAGVAQRVPCGGYLCVSLFVAGKSR